MATEKIKQFFKRLFSFLKKEKPTQLEIQLTNKITIHVKGVLVEVTLRHAKARDGIRRAKLMQEAAKLPADAPDKYAAFYLYPTCVSAVAEPEWVRAMPFEDFLDVEETEIDLWTGRVYDINPHWREVLRTLHNLTLEEEKKTGQLLNGLNQLTETLQQVTETYPPLKS